MRRPPSIHFRSLLLCAIPALAIAGGASAQFSFISQSRSVYASANAGSMGGTTQDQANNYLTFMRTVEQHPAEAGASADAVATQSSSLNPAAISIDLRALGRRARTVGGTASSSETTNSVAGAVLTLSQPTTVRIWGRVIISRAYSPATAPLLWLGQSAATISATSSGTPSYGGTNNGNTSAGEFTQDIDQTVTLTAGSWTVSTVAQSYFLGSPTADFTSTEDAIVEFRVAAVGGCLPPQPTVPATVRACRTGTATITVTPGGTGPYSFRWRKAGQFLTGDARITGATTATLSVSSLGASDQGSYDCLILNACGTIASNAATLRVCTADFNCSGTVSVQDLFDFLAAWFTMNPRADISGLGGVTIQDLFDFLAAWFAGCP